MTRIVFVDSGALNRNSGRAQQARKTSHGKPIRNSTSPPSPASEDGTFLANGTTMAGPELAQPKSSSTTRRKTPAVKPATITTDIDKKHVRPTSPKHDPPTSLAYDVTRLQAFAVHFSDQLDDQKREMERISRSLERMEDGMQAFRDFMQEVRTGPAFGASTNTSEEMDVVVRSVSKVWRKVNEVDGLTMELEMMKHRVKKLEDTRQSGSSALSTAAPPLPGQKRSVGPLDGGRTGTKKEILHGQPSTKRPRLSTGLGNRDDDDEEEADPLGMLLDNPDGQDYSLSAQMNRPRSPGSARDRPRAQGGSKLTGQLRQSLPNKSVKPLGQDGRTDGNRMVNLTKSASPPRRAPSREEYDGAIIAAPARDTLRRIQMPPRNEHGKRITKSGELDRRGGRRKKGEVGVSGAAATQSTSKQTGPPNSTVTLTDKGKDQDSGDEVSSYRSALVQELEEEERRSRDRAVMEAFHREADAGIE